MFAAVLCSAQTKGGKAPQLGKASVDKIVAAMTLEEKAQMLVGGERAFFNGKIGFSRKPVAGAAGVTVANSRLGIPVTVETDGPAGVRIWPTRKDDSKTYYCTGFPIASLLSSTWNTALVNKVGKAMGNEVLEYDCDVYLAPGMNIHRNPLNGRNFEYYSEDPLLTGKMAASMVLGVQSEGVGTSIKHFAANNQETFRQNNNSVISQRALREIYLKGFEIAVKEGHPWTIMSSYNKINGKYTQEDYSLLTTLLRDEWGFKGIVMTDWTHPRNIVAQVSAGNDLMMPGYQPQVDSIMAAVKDGRLPIADVNRNVKRVLEFILKTPHFRNYAVTNAPDLKAHAAVSRQAAEEGMVLLKNDGATLPFNGVKTVALFGTGSYNLIANGTGSGEVNKAYVVDLQQGLENAGFAVDPELKALYEEKADETNISSSYAKRRAQNADIAVITLSRNAGEGADRHNAPGDYQLTKTEMNMIKNVTKAFHAAGKKVIVIVNSGSVIETASWKDIPDAILLAWQPGQEGGNAIADVLKGAVNPSGKLPTTFPVDYMDIPSSKNFPYDFYGTNKTAKFDPDKKNIGYTNYDEGIWVGYRYFNTKNVAVSYPFGFGLSYTTFAYSAPKLSQKKNLCTVSVTVKNTGKVAGKEVVELYTSAPQSQMAKPACELKAFAKTKLLQPGESEVVNMTFAVSDMASFDEASNSWITDAGTYKVLIGSSVQNIQQTLSLKVGKTMVQKVKAKI